jgi:hypothetical protein
LDGLKLVVAAEALQQPLLQLGFQLQLHAVGELDRLAAARIHAAFHHPVLQQLLGLQVEAAADGLPEGRLVVVEGQLQLMQSQWHRPSGLPACIIGG